MYEYPFGNEQQLNLNWIISEIINIHKALDPDYEAPTFDNAFPFMNLNALNLDWIIRELKTIKDLAPTEDADLLKMVANALISETYDTTKQYNVDDIVYRDVNNRLYICKTATPVGGEPWTNSHWQEIKVGDVLTDLNNILNSIQSELSPINNYFYYYIDGVNGDDSNDGISTATPLKTLDAALGKHYEKDVRIRFLTAGTYNTNAQYFAGMALHLINYTQEYGGTLTPVTIYFNANHAVQFYNCYTHFENITLDWAVDLYFDGGFAYHINNVVFSKLTKFNGMYIVADSITYNKVAIQECFAKIHDITITTTDANDHSIYLRDSKTIIYGSRLNHSVINNDNGKAVIFTVRGELTYALTLPSNAPSNGRTYGLMTQQTNLYATETRLTRLANTTLQGNNIQSNYPCVVYKGAELLDLVEAFNEKQDLLTFDTTPTENSTNPITSGGVYSALNAKKYLNTLECGRVNNSTPMAITFTDATRGFIVIFGGATRQAMYLLNCNAGASPVTNEILQSVDNNFTLTPSVVDGNGVLTISANASNNCTVYLMLFTDTNFIDVN